MIWFENGKIGHRHDVVSRDGSACEVRRTPLVQPQRTNHNTRTGTSVLIVTDVSSDSVVVVMADDSGVELLRKSWEIEDHWVLRRDFMLAHKDKFPPERLLCLAQIFVNIETLGVGYDEEIMIENKNLGEEVASLAEFRRKKLQLQSEERFKAPARAAKNSHNEIGTRNVTHDRYQNHQQNYSQGRQNYAQHQQLHGYGKAQHHSYPGQTYGQGYNAQPAAPQQRYPQPNYQRQGHAPQQRQQQYRPSQHQPQYQQPVYGRYAASGQQQPQQGGYSGGNRGQGQPYGRDSQSGTGQGSSSYQNLLHRNQRR